MRNKGLSITPEEEEMRTRFEDIQDQLQRSEQFHGKLSQLWAQLQLIKESGRKYGKIDGVDEWDAVSENDMTSITKVRNIYMTLFFIYIYILSTYYFHVHTDPGRTR